MAHLLRRSFLTGLFLLVPLVFVRSAWAEITHSYDEGTKTLTITGDASDNDINPLCSEVDNRIVFLDANGVQVVTDAPCDEVERVIVNGGDGDDTIDVVGMGNASIFPQLNCVDANGGPGDDTVLLSETCTTSGEGGIDEVVVEGSGGFDIFEISDNAAGNVEVADIFGNIMELIGFSSITINGNAGNDILIGLDFALCSEVDLYLNGDDGDDEIIVGECATTLDGGPGGDRLGATWGPETDMEVLGGLERDLISLLLLAFSGLGGGVVSVDGGDGEDEVDLVGDGSDETFVVTEGGAGKNASNSPQVEEQSRGITIEMLNVETIGIDGMGGDDTIDATNATAALGTLDGGEGNDLIRFSGIPDAVLGGFTGISSDTFEYLPTTAPTGFAMVEGFGEDDRVLVDLTGLVTTEAVAKAGSAGVTWDIVENTSASFDVDFVVNGSGGLTLDDVHTLTVTTGALDDQGTIEHLAGHDLQTVIVDLGSGSDKLRVRGSASDDVIEVTPAPGKSNSATKKATNGGTVQFTGAELLDLSGTPSGGSGAPDGNDTIMTQGFSDLTQHVSGGASGDSDVLSVNTFGAGFTHDTDNRIITIDGAQPITYAADAAESITFDQTPIPVELAVFEAYQKGDGEVLLTWETASETNNAGFEVQRLSHDAGTETPRVSQWLRLAFIDGHGTTTEPQVYRFVDAALPFDVQALTYRLKQIDFDGTFEYSPVVGVVMAVPEHFALEANYPNPFNPSTRIPYTLPRSGEARLAVYDVLGREVAVLVDGPQQAGRHEVVFEAGDLPSGVYVYRLEARDWAQTRRMLLVK